VPRQLHHCSGSNTLRGRGSRHYSFVYDGVIADRSDHSGAQSTAGKTFLSTVRVAANLRRIAHASNLLDEPSRLQKVMNCRPGPFIMHTAIQSSLNRMLSVCLQARSPTVKTLVDLLVLSAVEPKGGAAGLLSPQAITYGIWSLSKLGGRHIYRLEMEMLIKVQCISLCAEILHR